MSVNLHLTITIQGHKPEALKAIQKAVAEVLESESIDDEFSPLKVQGSGKDSKLVARTNPRYPVISSSATEWLKDMQKALAKDVKKANGGPCKVVFEGVDADDDSDEDEEEEDTLRGKRYFEFVEGTSQKFWEITLAGKSLTTRWGRLGTTGQKKTKAFANASAATKEYDKLVAEKTRRGYKEK